jgi:predicted nucleic acid-binding protein
MLIDTSGFLCLLHKDEPEHHQTIEIFAEAKTFLTHSYILCEFVPLARVRGLPTRESLAFSQRILADTGIEVVWVDPDLHASAVSLLQNRLDKGYSLCDAVSFILMRERGIADALTTDKHFEQEGFIRLLR